MSSTHTIKFYHDKTALKWLLQGRGWHDALKALGYAERHDAGKLRKDGVTPAFHHQVQIAMCVAQLPSLNEPEEAVIAALLHDLREDHQVEHHTVEKKFGKRNAAIIELLTKKFGKLHKEESEYFAELALDPTASIVKGEDNCNNMASMYDAFELPKIISYTERAEGQVLPMLKRAMMNFPEQSQAFYLCSEKLKLLIKSARKYAEMAVDADNFKHSATTLKNEMEAMIARIADDRARVKAFHEADLVKLQEDIMREYAAKEAGDRFDLIASCTRRFLQAAKGDHAAHRLFYQSLVTVLASEANFDQRIRPIIESIRLDLGISELELIEFASDEILGERMVVNDLNQKQQVSLGHTESTMIDQYRTELKNDRSL